MFYSKEPKVLRDQIAKHMRNWYEDNRESWWARLRETPEPSADAFMLAFVFEVVRVHEEAMVQLDKQAASTGSAMKEVPIVRGKKKIK